jgi:hypothetical protein
MADRPRRKRFVVGDLSKAADRARAEKPAVKQDLPSTYVSEDGKTRRRRYVVQPIDQAARKVRGGQVETAQLEGYDEVFEEATRLAAMRYSSDDIAARLRARGVDETTALEVSVEARLTYHQARHSGGWSYILVGICTILLSVALSVGSYYAEKGRWVFIFSGLIVAGLGGISYGFCELRRWPKL